MQYSAMCRLIISNRLSRAPLGSGDDVQGLHCYNVEQDGKQLMTLSDIVFTVDRFEVLIEVPQVLYVILSNEPSANGDHRSPAKEGNAER